MCLEGYTKLEVVKDLASVARNTYHGLTAVWTTSDDDTGIMTMTTCFRVTFASQLCPLQGLDGGTFGSVTALMTPGGSEGTVDDGAAVSSRNAALGGYINLCRMIYQPAQIQSSRLANIVSYSQHPKI